MMYQGYKCVEITEFPVVTCRTPSGMGSSDFQVRNEKYGGTYLSPSRDYAWNCLNNSGQLWGSATKLQCVNGMR